MGHRLPILLLLPIRLLFTIWKVTFGRMGSLSMKLEGIIVLALLLILQLLKRYWLLLVVKVGLVNWTLLSYYILKDKMRSNGYLDPNCQNQSLVMARYNLAMIYWLLVVLPVVVHSLQYTL